MGKKGRNEIKLQGKKIGVVGVGTIGGTIIETLLNNDLAEPQDIVGSTSLESSAQEASETLGVEVTTDNRKVFRKCDLAIIAVEPKTVGKVLQEFNDCGDDQLIISVAAGITTEFIESIVDRRVPVIRTMPNMAITVNAGATGIVAGSFAKERHVALARAIFEPAGVVEQVQDEGLMDAITGFSGSGPAYGYLIIESLIEAGVRAGLPRGKATKLAAQSLLGAAKMVLDTNEHPARLKDMVTTPAGVTVDAIMKLEEGGVRVAFFNAIEKATEKSRQLKTKSSEQ